MNAMCNESKQSANQTKETSIAIIGGGASGIACAVYLVQCARQTGQTLKLVLFEAGKRPGRTILQSGNGRCNFSNAYLDYESYQNASFVSTVLNQLDSRWNTQTTASLHALLCQANKLDTSACQNAVVSWFESLGLMWTRASSEGLLYPESNKASTVWEVLISVLEKVSLEIRTDTPVAYVEQKKEGYSVVTNTGEKEHFSVVVVASGGKTPQELLSSFDLSFFKPYPVLCPLEIKGARTRNLNGLRVKASLTLLSKSNKKLREQDCHQTGEVLFRDYGLSGIAVFNLSRYAKPGDEIVLSLFPEYTKEQLEAYLSLRFAQAGYECLEEFLQGLVLPQLASLVFSEEELVSREFFAASAGRQEVSSSDIFAKIAHRLKTITFTIKKNRDDQSCQLHRGGVSVEEVLSETMEVKKYPGLYVLGEALDVDAPCGGYNLHWAFATGLVAGSSLAKKLGLEQPFVNSIQEVV